MSALIVMGNASIAPAAVSERVMLLAPASSSSTTTPVFSWHAVPQASYYLLRVTDWTNLPIDRWFTPAAAGCSAPEATCSVSLEAPLPPGPVTWQVQTWSPDGYGPWSDALTFAVDIADPLATAPQPIAPSGTLQSYSATYTWTPVTNAVIYRLAIRMNGGAESDWWLSPATLGCAGADASCATELTSLSNGSAEWRVQAWTVNGGSSWSPVVAVAFTIFPPPSTPQAIAPAGSATASPTFTWTAPDNVVYYYVLVDDATGNRVDQWLTPGEAGCLVGGATCTFAPAVVLESGVAQWRLLAWNPSGYSQFSATLTFTVPSGVPAIPNQIPRRVVPIGPSGSLSGTPTFTWQAQSAAAYYLVRVVNWTDSYIDRWFTPADASCSTGTGVCSAPFGATITPGPASWKVVAWSPAGYSPWSDSVDLVVDKVDPAAIAPLPVAPAGSLWSHTATFTWTAAPNAALYRLSMTIDGAASNDSWYTPAELGCTGSGPCRKERTVATNGSVRWKVQAWTAVGRSGWSAPLVVSFAVFPAPSTPIALGPTRPAGAFPTFTWMPSPHVVYYDVHVEDVKGNQVDRRLTPAEAGCAEERGTCAFTLSASLHPGRANWRVRGWNPSGASPWSSTLSFEVQGPGRAGK